MIDLLIILVFLAIGYGFGGLNEKRHFKSIFSREEQLSDILLFDSKLPPALGSTGGELVSGSVVVSVDYFKRFVAGLRLLFGGRLSTYESLLERGRREAVLRMKESAKLKGCSQVINIKFETMSISKGAGGALGSVEVLVYGSAIKASPIAEL